jgi:hypothetical protein
MATQVKERKRAAALPSSPVPPCPPKGNDEEDNWNGPFRPPSAWRPPPEQFSVAETACIIAAAPQFWTLADWMPRNTDIVGMRGRKPKSADYAKLLVACLTWECISMLATVTELTFASTWTAVRKVLEENRPAEWDSAPLGCPSLSQMKSFNQKLARLGEQWREEAMESVARQAVRDAQARGYLDPERKTSWSKPDGRDFVVTDGTVMLPAFGSGQDDSLGPQIVYNDEAAKNKPIGAKVLTTSVHGDAPGSRMILRADMVPPGPNGSPGGESAPIAHAVRSIADAANGGLAGVIVDSVIRGKVVADLDRQGYLTVNYPHAQSNPNRAEGGRKADGRIERTLELPPMRHKTKGGAYCEHDLVLVGSVPNTRVADDEGNEQFTSLPIVGWPRRQNKDSTWRSYHTVEVSCIHGNFRHTYRLFPEDETGINYGEVARFYPTGSEQFADLYGRRNATESWHAELKRRRRRLPVRGMAMQSFYLCCMVVTQNAKSIERMKRAAAPPGSSAA